MKLWKQYWLWIILLVSVTFLLLRPLLFRPELLQPILPGSWYDSWEEFAVMQLSGLLAFGMLSLAFLVFGIGIFRLFSAKDGTWKKVGIAAGYSILAFWVFWSGMLFFSYGTRERYRRIACQSNLKQIITALYWYAEENGGVYPSDLRTLSTAEYLTDESVYRCPSRRAPKPEFSDYQYLGKGRLRDEAAFPILRDLPGNHPGRYRCVLFSDGSVCAETDAGNTKEKRY